MVKTNIPVKLDKVILCLPVLTFKLNWGCDKLYLLEGFCYFGFERFAERVRVSNYFIFLLWPPEHCCKDDLEVESNIENIFCSTFILEQV